MDARIARATWWWVALSCTSGWAAAYRTPNFVVTAPTPAFAAEVARAAEHYRKTLAEVWLGKELPPWRQPCPVTVRVSPQLGAGGVTSFMFDNGRPFGWRMSIQGSSERILDSVLPHEVTHTIFATHFGGPLPRWADEGACTTVEHPSERAKHYQHLYNYLTTKRGIPFNQMFAMTEYPPDIMPLYAQGHSVVEFLLQHANHRRFVDFLGNGMRSGNWDRAVQQYYGFRDLSDLQVRWVAWLHQGRPPIGGAPQLAAATPSPVALAAHDRGQPGSDSLVQESALVRGQDGNASSADSWYSRQRARSKEAAFGPPGVRAQIAESAMSATGARSTGHAPESGQVQTSVLDWGEEGYWQSRP